MERRRETKTENLVARENNKVTGGLNYNKKKGRSDRGKKKKGKPSTSFSDRSALRGRGERTR